VLPGNFGVAENGAVWITESGMGDRALPFICEHLLLVLPLTEILSNMHEAYERIGDLKYDLGTFIAGPSKTADIEQSLVLGAHGPKSLTVILVGKATANNFGRQS
jgi:L-lactate dehydrogenase complex protein LldG